MRFDTDNIFRPLYSEVDSYFGQPVVYNGRNFILTLVKQGQKGEPFVIINNGWTIKDPFSKPVKQDYQNCTIFGLYYKLSDPNLLKPKKGRIKRLWKKHPEYFGCRGLLDSAKELQNLVTQQMAWEKVIIVGFTKSATMILNNVLWSENVIIYAICPIFKGTYSTMPEIMKKNMHIFWKLVSWILSEHLVDEDISAHSEYLQKADYSKMKGIKANVIMSSLDKSFAHSLKEKLHLIDVFFRAFLPIIEKTIEKEEGPQEHMSNAFLSFDTQWPPDEINANLDCIYASMPRTLNHPKVKQMIQKQIYEIK